MRIGLIAADINHKHGWAHYSYEVIAALNRRGADITVIASTNSDPLESVSMQRILPALVPRESLLSPKLISKIPAIQRALRHCDVIHGLVEPFAIAADAVAGRRPLVLSGVGSYLHIDSWARFPLSRWYHRAFNRASIIAISHYAERIAQTVFPHARTCTVPLATDITRYGDIPVERPPQPMILSVGGIKPRKGTLPLVRALARVRDQIPDVRCVIVGNPAEGSDYTRQVRAEIDRLGLHDCVTITGFIPEDALRAYYAQAAVFSLPSMNSGWMFEGFGLVHLEASSAGLPVIGTRDCGCEDAVDHEQTGLLVSQSNIDDELPVALIRLLGDASLRYQMGKAGREKARRWTWDDLASEYLAVYSDLLKKGAR